MKLLTYFADILVLIKLSFIDSINEMKKDFWRYFYSILTTSMPLSFITIAFTMDSVNNFVSFISLVAMVAFIVVSCTIFMLLADTFSRLFFR